MGENGYIKLADFGLSKESKKEDQTSTFCGTADYVAPEMINKSSHDRSVDWWMLGINIYEMLSGDTPFAARDKMQVYKKIQNVV